MATLDQLGIALKNAHKAGDTAAAQKLAAEIKRQRAQTPERPPAKMTDDFGGIDPASAKMMQGLSFGWGDEATGALVAGVKAPFSDRSFGEIYDESVDNQRRAAEAMENEHPYAGAALEIGGGLLSGGPLIKGGAALAKGAGMAAKALAGAATGAGAGAVYGAGKGETPSERLEGGATGAIIGGGVGAAAPVVGGAIGAGARKILDNRTVNQQLGRIGLGRPDADILARTMQADDTLGAQGAKNIAQAGDEAMFADAGPNARSVLDTVIQRGGRGAMEAQRRIEERAARANDRITGSLDQSLGTPQGVRTTETNLRTSTAGARGQAYDAAYASPIDYAHPAGQELEALLSRIPRNVFSRANQLMKLEGEESRQILIKIGPNGKATIEKMPDVRQLDYITRAMNDVSKAGDGRGALGGNTAEGRAFGNLSSAIRQKVRELAPEYGNALDTAADPIKARQALQFGAEMMRTNVPRDVVAETLRGMSQSERAHVAQGIRSQIDEALANVRAAASDPNVDARQALAAVRDLSRSAAREKLELLLGRGAAPLLRTLDQSMKAMELRAGTATNSRTFARTSTNQSVKDAVEPGALSTLMEGKPLEAGRKLLRVLMGQTPKDRIAKEDVIYDRLAKVLTEKRGRAAQADLSRLAQAMQAGQRNAAIGDRIRRTVTGGVAVPGYLSGQQYLSSRR